MAQAMYFSPKGFTAQQYDEVDRRLDAVGARTPEGRLYHVAFGSGTDMMVFDVWESQEKFDAFGQKLMPILQELGIDPGQPMISTTHNILKG